MKTKKEIEEEIKIYEQRCVCTEEYYCKPCRRVERLKKLLEEKEVDDNVQQL